MPTLEQTIRKNRERQIGTLEQVARLATARANRYRKDAQDVADHPAGYLDPQGEVAFLLACAEPFNVRAHDARAKIAALRALLA
jgi:hypothetical protein